MYNPFEPDTLRWHLFNELAETLTSDSLATPLEMAEVVNEVAAQERPLPPRPIPAR